MIYVKNPNFPINTAAVLIGEEYFPLLSDALSDYGIKVLSVPKNPYLDPRIASHADLSVLHLGENVLYASSHIAGTELEAELIELCFEIEYSEANFGPFYPDDCPLNIYLSEKFAVLNPQTADKSLLTLDSTIYCRQGYTKCMICPVDSKSIITSDPSIASACREKGIEVLKISQGFVDLAGYEYGFLGGACFKLSENMLAFTGKLDLHPDKELILQFLSARGIEAVFLSDKNVFDVGSIIPIMEKPR